MAPDNRDIEETSLEAHVRICEIRYEVLNKKQDQIEKRLNELNEKVEDIHKILSENKNSNQKTIIVFSAIVMAALLATIVVLIVHKF